MTCTLKKEPGYYQTHSYTINQRAQGNRKTTVAWRSTPDTRRAPEEQIAKAVAGFMRRKRKRENDGAHPIGNYYWNTVGQISTNQPGVFMDILIEIRPWENRPTVRQAPPQNEAAGMTAAQGTA